MSTQVLGRRIAAWGNLPEHAMRRSSLERFLSAVSPHTTVHAIEELLVAVRTRRHDAINLYLALIEIMECAAWVGDCLEAWRNAAAAAGLAEVSLWLQDPAPQRVLTDDDDLGLHPDLVELTLGERKSRARLADPRALEAFVTETDPQVLQILLQHPGMNERLLLRILSRRPQDARVMEALVAAPKWLRLASVHSAVVLNPYAPPRLALRLLPLLKLDAIRDVLQSRDLHSEVYAYARRLSVLKDYTDVVDLDSSGASVELRA